MKVSKRFLDRAKPALRRFQKLFESAAARDVNESDTCVLVSDFLQEVLGYDKYSDVTTEFAVRSTFCDLAIKTNGQLQYLIEVKSVGTDLKENHVRQAIDYAANQGVDWVLLTNGARWQAYKLRFEKPIQADEVFSVDLLDTATKAAEHLEKLYLISREAGGDSALSGYWQQKEATSRYVLAHLLLDDTVLGTIRRELKVVAPGVRVDEDTLRTILSNEVIKRDCLEGERAQAAQRLARRAARKRQKAKLTDGATGTAPVPEPPIGPAAVAVTAASPAVS